MKLVDLRILDLHPKCGHLHNGQMLLIVLWVMGLVTIVIGALVVRAGHETRLGRIALETLRRQALAQAGVAYAVRALQQDAQERPEVDSLQESWASGQDAGGQPLFDAVKVGDGAGTFSLGRREDDQWVPGLIDEERKLNLNTAPVDALRRLIERVGTGAGDAEPLATAIADWRDEPVGPVCSEPERVCHNGPLESVEELLALPGVTPTLFAALEPYVTVYGSGFVNVNTAPVVVLDALGLPGAQVAQERQQQPFTVYPGFAVTSSAFTVAVETSTPQSSLTLALRAVVDRSGAILAWSAQ